MYQKDIAGRYQRINGNQQIVEITAGSIFPAIYHIYRLPQVSTKSPHLGYNCNRLQEV